MNRWVTYLAMLSLNCALGSQSEFRGRLDPHYYGGLRGNEPGSQVLVQGTQEWRARRRADRQWRVLVHGEIETMGRRDASFDLDRAWTEVFSEGSGSWQLIVGRAHPWDLSGHLMENDPWSASATQQAQNRGVLLGYGWDAGKPTPQPSLMGWLGLHLWSDRSGEAPAAIGISATPVFVPSLGSEVSLSGDGPVRVGRFGRRPPGTALIEGKEIPISYQLSSVRLWEDVLFHPQVMLQSRFQTAASETARWRSWITLSRAPRPDPVTSASGVLKLTQEKLEAFAIVQPQFPSLWMLDVTQSLSLGGGFWSTTLFNSLYAKEDGSRGFEVGVSQKFLKLSLLNTKWVRSAVTGVSYSGASYGEWLVRAESAVDLPLWNLRWFGGVYRHTQQRDTWARTALRIPFASKGSLDLGADLFSGSENTYFGEWRTNDRVFAVLTWEIFE